MTEDVLGGDRASHFQRGPDVRSSPSGILEAGIEGALSGKPQLCNKDFYQFIAGQHTAEPRPRPTAVPTNHNFIWLRNVLTGAIFLPHSSRLLVSADEPVSRGTWNLLRFQKA
jgi:hypothetical protein